MPKSTKKLTELLLYVASKSEGDGSFGMTKLNKLMFFSDFSHYKKTGRSITDTTYVRNHRGPTIKDLHLVLNEMESNRVSAIKETDFHGYPQKRLIALRRADISQFTVDEIDTVGSVLSLLKGHNASEVSEASHEFVGWRFARQGEEIPYMTINICSPEQVAESMSDEELRQASEYD